MMETLGSIAANVRLSGAPHVGRHARGHTDEIFSPRRRFMPNKLLDRLFETIDPLVTTFQADPMTLNATRSRP